ncbi:MAG: hypothetical protein M0Z85_12535 [Gammaproteobacteria bacterium]|nr:hypothetical protein [Gammaproteobacteria bacterium]
MGVYNWSYGSAIATIIAAVITTVAAIWINRQTRKSERIRDGMLIDAEVRNQEFQKTQARVGHALSLLSQEYAERFSLKVQAIVEMSRILGEVGYYLERYTVPYTGHVPMSKAELLQKAEETLEAAMKFRWENRLFIWHNDKDAPPAIGRLMGAINAFRSRELNGEVSTEESVRRLFEDVYPAFEVIRDAYMKELNESETRLTRGIE